jgi:hypothetical protein
MSVVIIFCRFQDTFIPVEKYTDALLLKKIGFYTEGIITEPYKKISI